MTESKWASFVKKWWPVFTIATFVIVLDQITKVIITTTLEPGETWLRQSPVQITYIRNSGSAFGLFQNQTFPLIIASFIAIAFILFYFRNSVKPPAIVIAAMGMQLGGAFGNLIDRIRLGYVVDFIDVQFWPIFNVADSSISISLVMLAFYVIVLDKSGKKPAEPAPAPASEVAPADAASPIEPRSTFAGKDIKAILFGLGGTLWQFPGERMAYMQEEQSRRMESLLADKGVDRSRAAVLSKAMWEEYDSRVALDPLREPNLMLILRGLIGNEDIDMGVENFWMKYYLGAKEIGIELKADSMSTLEWAKQQGYKLGIVTNRPTGGTFLARDLSQLGLSGYFTAVVASSDVGFRKPSPIPVLSAINALGVEPEETLLIGDRIDTDIAAARAAGCTAVLLDHGGSISEGTVDGMLKPDAVIHSLGELKTLLAKRVSAAVDV